MKKLFVILLFLAPSFLFAQEHEHSRNEIGVSPGLTYSPNHKEWGFGFHLHYFRAVSHDGRWSIGGAIENVISHDIHYGVSLGASYRITDGFKVAVMPGLNFLFDEYKGRYEPSYSTHFELVYDIIHTKNFHIGPVIEYSLSAKDSHAMVGAHFSYVF